MFLVNTQSIDCRIHRFRRFGSKKDHRGSCFMCKASNRHSPCAGNEGKLPSALAGPLQPQTLLPRLLDRQSETSSSSASQCADRAPTSTCLLQKRLHWSSTRRRTQVRLQWARTSPATSHRNARLRFTQRDSARSSTSPALPPCAIGIVRFSIAVSGRSI